MNPSYFTDCVYFMGSFHNMLHKLLTIFNASTKNKINTYTYTVFIKK